ncbi:murein hydrolase activator EnvC family protein [Allofournierella sp.]|uniref:murein hydrolase activator EnvC family protein n=1 Tax=Allofournierella sp. TaxID=1940256 RepID=UPI003AB37181
MRRFVLWLLLVALFTCALLAGALGFFWWRADESALPRGGVSLAGQDLGAPAGYDWQVPVLGGVLWRRHSRSPDLNYQRLAGLTDPAAPLEVTGELAASATTLTLTDAAGAAVFQGSAAQWADFSFSHNGDYTLEIRAGRASSGEKPAKPVGYNVYQCRFSVDLRPTLALSAPGIAQGGTAAVYVGGFLPAGASPAAQCELGPVWFTRTAAGWLGFLPVAYNAERGEYPLTVTLGGYTLAATVTVELADWGKADAGPGGPSPAGANEQFRSAIWGFYSQGSGDPYWNGAFSAPVSGDTLRPYGAYLYSEDGALSGRSAGIGYLCGEDQGVRAPAPGRVAYAGQLALTGGTLVLDHGCGVKSYLFGLAALNVQVGEVVTQGAALGQAGEALTWEVRIGNKSVDPGLLTRGQGGLFYQPRG